MQRLTGGYFAGMCEELQNSKVASGKGAIETGGNKGPHKVEPQRPLAGLWLIQGEKCKGFERF